MRLDRRAQWRRWRILLILTLLGFVSPASAIPLLEELGPTEAELPLSGRSASASPLVAYYSPALLQRRGQRLMVSLLTTYESLQIGLLPRPAGYDVPSSIYRAQLPRGLGFTGPTSRSLPTQALPAARPSESLDQRLRPTLIAGFSSALIEERLSLGFVAVSPIGIFQSQRPFFVDEREQFFSNRLYHEFSGDRLEQTTFSLALAYHPHQTLSLGVGATLGNRSQSVAQIYLPDAGDQERSETNPQVEVQPVFTPHFSLAYRPLGDDRLSFSLSAHLASKSRLSGQGQLRLWDFEYPEGQNALSQPFELTFSSEPLRVSFGSAWTQKLSSAMSMKLYGDLLWVDWSEYQDRHSAQPRGWSDTLSARLGVGLIGERHSGGLGLSYQPSPVPEQTGRSNYVDNDRLSVQLGWRWRLPLDEKLGTLSFGISLQLQRLLERWNYKRRESGEPIGDELFDGSVDLQSGAPLPEAAGLQTNNPGFPGFSSSGWLSTALLSFELER